ncbi:hypothetical protein BS47DRAFT_1367060 [Hydnum rufescens UP504]|uniref:Uncharacterized protein n=1 Tax=Hydnum rufescens UP504 TaxID=1448309 RepID=A0A9P6AJ88_9AGAM|nr:hypothetical protein BS47DRAFT_1367060 [Hydnum rufescens UP504]
MELKELLVSPSPPSLWPARLVNYSSTIKAPPVDKPNCSQQRWISSTSQFLVQCSTGLSSSWFITLCWTASIGDNVSYIDKLMFGGIAYALPGANLGDAVATMVADFTGLLGETAGVRKDQAAIEGQLRPKKSIWE